MNTGKDAAFIKHIQVSCPRGNAYLMPDSPIRLLPDAAVQIDFQMINIRLRKQENCTLSLYYSDIFENFYAAEIYTQYSFQIFSDLENGDKYLMCRKSVVIIGNPEYESKIIPTEIK
jgi:hypothetical protein